MDVFWLLVRGGGYILACEEWWWMVVDGGRGSIVQCSPYQNLIYYLFPIPIVSRYWLMFITFIFIEVGLFCCFFLSIIMAWNLSGFTIIMFSLNHCTAFSDSEVNLFINSSRDFSVHDIVLPSPKQCNLAFSIQSKRLLMKMLKRMGLKLILVELQIIKLGRHYIYYFTLHFVIYPLNKKSILSESMLKP